MANSLRPSPLSFDSGRQSPFKRQNSASPATVRATTPTQSPTKQAGGLSPTKTGSLSPEKTSAFVRRPSTISQTSDRPTSPFARPTSSLSIPTSSTRQISEGNKSENVGPYSPQRTSSPEDMDVSTPSRLTLRTAPSPSPFDGAIQSTDARDFGIPSQANLRPIAQRTTTASSTTSTVKPLDFGTTALTQTAPSSKPASMAPRTTATTFNTGNTAFKNVPQPLLHSMRESFEVLDSSNSGNLTASSLPQTLDQLGLPSDPSSMRSFFPPTGPNQLNLARYLDTLSAPLASLSPPEELMAAFSAFDVDDSGQIDLAELRRAVLTTAPEIGEEDLRMNEKDLDGILGEFSGRRVFGVKGVNVAKGKGEVFRWREFIGAVSGGGNGQGQEVSVA